MGTSTMKADQDFREQVGQMTAWFNNWSECEQSVALYSLLKKLKPVQAKFLVQVLQQSLSDCTQVKASEEKANDPDFLSQLVREYRDTAVVQLLRYLPLLRSGNEAAKAVFLQVIPEVLSHSLETGVTVEESRQLLSYSLIHPAFTLEERGELRHWLSTLEGKLSQRLAHSALGKCLVEATSQTPTPANSSSLSSLSSSSLSCTCNGIMQNGVKQNGGVSGWQTSFPVEPIGPPPVASGASGTEPTDVVSGSASSILMKNLGYQHLPLRVSNSHIGAISSMSNCHTPLHATSSAPPNFGALAMPDPQAGLGGQPNQHAPLCRTKSHMPPSGESGPSSSIKVKKWLECHDSDHTTTFTSLRPGPPNLPQVHPSYDPAHAPLSPQSSVTSSGSGGSDSHHDDGPQPMRDSFLEEGSGMRDVPVWLKSLRLHKYSYLLKQLTYEEMMSLSEDWLAARNVTKGARHKIVLSIQKLHERHDTLRQMEKDIVEGASIKNTLSEMKSMLNTPVKAFTPQDFSSPPPSPTTIHDDNNKVVEGDLPGQFTRLMGKVCTQLLCTRNPDDECFTLFLHLIDKCINHEAFTTKQRNLLSSWRQETQKIWQPPNHKFLDKPRKSWGNTFPLNMSARFNSKLGRGQMKMNPMQWSFGTKRSLLNPTSSCHLPLQRNGSLNITFLNRPGLLEGKQSVTRTHSAPIPSGQLQLSVPSDQSHFVSDLPSTDTEINASLDSLCLRMTEHALGSSDLNDRGSTF